MTFTAPIFWHHQGPRAHQLPDARSDVKGRTVLRKIRAGYTTISPQLSASPPPTAIIVEEPVSPVVEEPVAPVEEPVVAAADEELPPTPPQYETLDPPAYTHPLPPTLPGYTALPDVPVEPTLDLKQPGGEVRRRRRDALRRRISSTTKRWRIDDSVSGDSEGAPVCEADSESARGVVLYRDDNDRWARIADEPRYKGEMAVKQPGFRAWLKRTWNKFMEWSDKHPYLFILALFVIVVVVCCVLI